MSGLFEDVINNVGEPYKGGNGFTYGTHEVIIGTAEAKQKKTQKHDAAEIIEVVVIGKEDNNKEATCTLWFHTEGAAKMSVTKILGMLVHNVGEEKKEAVRELGKKLFGSIDDLTESRNIAAKLMNDKLITKEAYLVAEPQGNYTTTAYGDLWHYPAEPQNPMTNTTTPAVAEDVTEELKDEIPDFDAKAEDL